MYHFWYRYVLKKNTDLYPSADSLFFNSVQLISPSTSSLYFSPSTGSLYFYPSTGNLYVYPSTDSSYPPSIQFIFLASTESLYFRPALVAYIFTQKWSFLIKIHDPMITFFSFRPILVTYIFTPPIFSAQYWQLIFLPQNKVF